MSKDTDRATPRPWAVEHDGESDERTCFPVITFEARNIAVVEAYYGDGAANAALIVRAVNAHEALVTACEAGLADLTGPQTLTKKQACDLLRAALALAHEVQP